jgi:hypothetical protein
VNPVVVYYKGRIHCSLYLQFISLYFHLLFLLSISSVKFVLYIFTVFLKFDYPYFFYRFLWLIELFYSGSLKAAILSQVHVIHQKFIHRINEILYISVFCSVYGDFTIRLLD